MASVQVTRLEVPNGVFGGGQVARAPIRKDQFFAEFVVTADLTSCYAIDVKLVEDDSQLLTFGLNRDEVIAAITGATYPAFCLQKGQQKTFAIGASGPPLGNNAPLAPRSTPTAAALPGVGGVTGAVPAPQLLPELEGFWPASDPGTELEVRLEVRVFRTQASNCDGTAPCAPVSARRLKGLPVVGFGLTEEVDIGLHDGSEPFEIAEPFIREGVEQGAGALMGRANLRVEDQALALFAQEFAEQKRMLRRIQGRITQLERNGSDAPAFAVPAAGVRPPLARVGVDPMHTDLG